MVEALDPASTRVYKKLLNGPGYNTSAWSAKKTSLPFFICHITGKLVIRIVGFPSSSILEKRKHDVSETGSVSVLKRGKG
jgi:hypothetical protein